MASNLPHANARMHPVCPAIIGYLYGTEEVLNTGTTSVEAMQFSKTTEKYEEEFLLLSAFFSLVFYLRVE